MARPLMVGKVIGDVLEMFTPAMELTAHYGPRQVANGCTIKPSAALDRPLVMVDPDAPSPSEPTLRELLHWIVVDIPEGSDATEGKEVVQYMGPQPPTGIHRYVMAVFKQKGGGATSQVPQGRAQFSTRQFAAHNGLGVPVAAFYFNSHKEPVARKR